MIEKIINGTYKAKLLKKRLCDVKIIVWGNGEPKTIEQVSYNEYNIIEPYLVKRESNLPYFFSLSNTIYYYLINIFRISLNY